MAEEKRDALFSRFVELFQKFLSRKQLTYGFATPVSIHPKQAELRKLFDWSWATKDLPTKQVLVEGVRFIGLNPMFEVPEDFENYVTQAFSAALAELKIEEHEHGEERLSQSQRQSKPGRKANPKVALRRKIVGNHINEKEDFDDEEKLRPLFQELDRKEIPPPEDIDKFSSFACSWVELLRKPGKLARVVKVLNRDRWPRKKSDLIKT